ncbi:MAG: hypothetical protein AB7O62_11610, partial [Pirellulales bacterium]
EAARGLAQQTLLNTSLADDSARLNDIFRRVLCRPARDSELARLNQRLALLRNNFTQDAAAAEKLLSVGESPRDATLDPAELAAWTSLASLVQNLDEAITKE